MKQNALEWVNENVVCLPETGYELSVILEQYSPQPAVSEEEIYEFLIECHIENYNEKETAEAIFKWLHLQPDAQQRYERAIREVAIKLHVEIYNMLMKAAGLKEGGEG